MASFHCSGEFSNQLVDYLAFELRTTVFVCCLFFTFRYHLQALRHLCVLAAEPRLLVPVDVDTLKPCYALLDITYKVLHMYMYTCIVFSVDCSYVNEENLFL